MNLIERLYEEHKGIDIKLEKLAELSESFNSDNIESIRKLFEELQKDIKAHLKEEEELLFPELIKKMGTSATSLQLILKEHEEIKHLLSEIEKIVNNGNISQIYSAVHSLTSKLEDHLRKENNLLYSIAHEFIDAETLKEKNKLAVQIRQSMGL